jgi:cyanophycin synthetase
MIDRRRLHRTALKSALVATRIRDSIYARLRGHRARNAAGFDDLRRRFYRDYWSHASDAVGARLEDLGDGFLRIQRGAVCTLVRGYNVQMDDHVTLMAAGNKAFTHRRLTEQGHPTPSFREFSLSTLEHARRFLEQLDGNAVVKPAVDTGSGHGVTTGVDSTRALRRAAIHAAMWSPRLLIEPEVRGSSFRLLYLDGRFLEAVRRDPPVVTGDGKHSLKALMRDETEARLTARPIRALHPLTVDADCRAALRAQGLSPASVVELGRRVAVKSVVNQNAAPQNHRVSEELHPATVEMGRSVVSMFGIELGGIDVLTPDLSLPLADCGGVINEVNTTPGLHHHALVSGVQEPLPIGPMILEHLLSRSRTLRSAPTSAQC